MLMEHGGTWMTSTSTVRCTQYTCQYIAETKAEILRKSGEDGRESINKEDFQVHMRTEGYNEVVRRCHRRRSEMWICRRYHL